VSLPIIASDPNGNLSLTWSASGLPAGLSIDIASGLVTGMSPASAVSDTPYDVTVDVSDTAGSTGTVSFQWFVTHAYRFTTVPGNGDGQSAPVNTVYGQPLKVMVVDETNTPAAGALVQFSAPF